MYLGITELQLRPSSKAEQGARCALSEIRHNWGALIAADARDVDLLLIRNFATHWLGLRWERRIVGRDASRLRHTIAAVRPKFRYRRQQDFFEAGAQREGNKKLGREAHERQTTAWAKRDSCGCAVAARSGALCSVVGARSWKDPQASPSSHTVPRRSQLKRIRGGCTSSIRKHERPFE